MAIMMIGTAGDMPYYTRKIIEECNRTGTEFSELEKALVRDHARLMGCLDVMQSDNPNLGAEDFNTFAAQARCGWTPEKIQEKWEKAYLESLKKIYGDDFVRRYAWPLLPAQE